MNLNFWFFLVAVCFAFPAFGSGSRIGNGGHGVRCGKNPSRVDLLDLVEARYSGLAVDESSQSFGVLTELKIINNTLRDVGLETPGLSATILNAQNLFSSISLEDVLEPTSDAYFYSIPDSCSVEQIAHLEQGSVNRLFILKRYWLQASDRERALLLLHEGMHITRMRSGKTDEMDTMQIRRLVGLLSQTPSGLSDSKSEINAALKKLGLRE
ncbi:MAG: hypothetical protein EOP06_01365 [Proteobacteria bacterium]|nr:MAG: hypothetical protein EOP06_01365 [Pseudomonadota bacterium]